MAQASLSHSAMLLDCHAFPRVEVAAYQATHFWILWAFAFQLGLKELIILWFQTGFRQPDHIIAHPQGSGFPRVSNTQVDAYQATRYQASCHLLKVYSRREPSSFDSNKQTSGTKPHYRTSAVVLGFQVIVQSGPLSGHSLSHLPSVNRKGYHHPWFQQALVNQTTVSHTRGGSGFTRRWSPSRPPADRPSSFA